MKKVVVIGGGTGTFTILRGLKKYPLDITAVVTMADSGGSSGRLRDEFGVLPPGDIRQCLAALADSGDTDLIRELFLYRFDKGDGLSGHNFGNLFLTALTEITGSDEAAIKAASKLLRIKGKVLPVTNCDCKLCIELEDGFVVKGEDRIDEPLHNGEVRIKKVWLEPNAKCTDEVIAAIGAADLIILGPGDLYTSIIVNLVVDGVVEAIRDKKVLYVANLISKYGQSYRYSLSEHVKDLEKYLNRKIDYILYNSTELPAKILTKYSEEKGYSVKNDIQGEKRVVAGDLIVEENIKQKSGDVVKRSMLSLIHI